MIEITEELHIWWYNVYIEIIKRLLFYIFLPLFLGLLLAPSVFAKGTERTILLSAQTIQHDYFAANEVVDIQGTVNGDAYVAGGEVTVNGSINGDLLVVGGQVNIDGIVRNNLRVLGGNINIRGTVGRNISAVGGNITIEKGARINGNLVSAGGNIEVLSPVRDFTVAGGNVRVGSTIQRNMMAGVGNLTLTPNARVGGNLEYWSEEQGVFSQGASVSGRTTFHQTTPPEKEKGAVEAAIKGASLVFEIVGFLSSFLVGLLLLWVAPVYMRDVAMLMQKRFGMSLLMGLVILIVTPIAILLFIVTILGIPIALMLLALYLIELYLSHIVVSFSLGMWIKGYMNKKANMYLTFTVGLIVYYIVGFIPLIGGLTKFIVLLVGIGALVMQKQIFYQLLRSKKLL